MPFGLQGAPATFQCLFDKVLQGCEDYADAYFDIGIGSGGQGGATRPPSFKLGGHRPPNFTHCLHNELHCSVVEAVLHNYVCIVPQGNHIIVV